MFSRKDICSFCVSVVLVISGYGCMMIDSAAYGFGVLTLWIAPPILLIGFSLPVLGIIGIRNLSATPLLNFFKTDWAVQLSAFAVFAIAMFMYIITLEPTASLWDCSEFIAAAFKLQVPHAPGGPLFLLFARLFAMLSWHDVTKVAWHINLMSAFFSALTVYIVFHTICLFGTGLKVAGHHSKMVVILSAMCGSLCLAFSDTFWFSAVEAESYATASFFLVLQVWLIVSANDLSTNDRSRRLVLIFYLAGLSYCVHPMCVLALALLPFCWKITMRTTALKILSSLAIGIIIVLAINRLIAVGFFELMFAFDLFFVNTIHLPFYTGAWVMAVSIVLIIIFVMRRYRRYESYTWAVVFLLLGFVPYVMLFIRSNDNPPIDETNPENLALIKAYMKRESYGSAPLLYGPYFDAEIEAVSEKSKMYYKDTTTYKIAGTTSEYRYQKSRQTIFPRMYSNDENHIKSYRQWTGLQVNEKPTFLDNLEFLLTFQLGEMYLRYVLFNFAGKESDVQYNSWLRPWDTHRSISDKSRNQYWMVPLIVGILGSIYHARKNARDFFTVLIFFLVTGAILAFYLNAPPNEPRERDYIYVGSFIAYCIWIGVGGIAIGNLCIKYKHAIKALPMIAVALPGWMAYQNFDDHDRSGRTFQIDNARNLLQSCAPNSILFGECKFEWRRVIILSSKLIDIPICV